MANASKCSLLALLGIPTVSLESLGCTVRAAVGFVAAVLIGTTALPAFGATYYYVDWTSADVAAGSAIGTITLPDLSTVTVTFQAVNVNGTPGNLYGAQTSGGTNYWIPSAPYISSAVSNAPPGTDILQLSGGQNQTYVVTLSQPIKDPIMAIVSLGQPGITTTYGFNSPFTIVSQGAGYWGNGPLTQLPGNVLQGAEGHGTIQFIGTFSTFSWTVPTPETWHGFTFGIRTTTALEPDYTVTASVSGGGGTATCSPSPVSRGASSVCTATPSAGYAFTGWTSGACAGLPSTCTLNNVTSNLSSVAAFQLASTGIRADVPTMSEWALIIMAGLMALMAFGALRQRM